MSELKLTSDEQLEQALIYIDNLQDAITELISIAERDVICNPFHNHISKNATKIIIDRANKLIQP